MAHLTTQEVIQTLNADMTAANQDLLDKAPDRFNRYVLNLIQNEIKIGKTTAERERSKDPDSRMYVHHADFPLAVYEGMTPSFLKELDAMDICIYRKEPLNKAIIKIVFRF